MEIPSPPLHDQSAKQIQLNELTNMKLNKEKKYFKKTCCIFVSESENEREKRARNPCPFTTWPEPRLLACACTHAFLPSACYAGYEAIDYYDQAAGSIKTAKTKTNKQRKQKNLG